MTLLGERRASRNQKMYFRQHAASLRYGGDRATIGRVGLKQGLLERLPEIRRAVLTLQVDKTRVAGERKMSKALDRLASRDPLASDLRRQAMLISKRSRRTNKDALSQSPGHTRVLLM